MYRYCTVTVEFTTYIIPHLECLHYGDSQSNLFYYTDSQVKHPQSQTFTKSNIHKVKHSLIHAHERSLEALMVSLTLANDICRYSKIIYTY